MGAFDNFDLGNVATAGVGSVVDMGLGMLGSMFQTNQQKKLMKYQYKLQKEFYDYQNEYNTPANQIARLKLAGLNPNLAYGSLSGNVAQNSMSVSHGGASQLDTGGMFSKYMMAQQYAEQKRVNDSVINANNANAEKARAQAKREGTLEQKDSLDLTQQRILFTNGTWERGIQQALNLGDANLNIANATYNNLLKDLDVKDADINRIDSETALNYAKGNEIANGIMIAWRRLRLDERLGEAECQKAAALIGLYGAQAGLYNEQAETERVLRPLKYTQEQQKIRKSNAEWETFKKELQLKLDEFEAQVQVAKNAAYRSRVKNFQWDSNKSIWTNVNDAASGVLFSIFDFFGASASISKVVK